MRHQRLFWQLYPSYFLIIALVLAGLGWTFSISLRNFHYQQTVSDLKARAHLVALQLQEQLAPDRSAGLNDYIARQGQQSGTRITLIAQDGRVLADSHQKPAGMDNHGQRPEILLAVAQGEGVAVRYSDSVQQQQMYYAMVVETGNTSIRMVRVSISMDVIDRALSDLYRRLMTIGLVVALAIIPVAWLLSRRISRPLELMTSAAQRFSQGDMNSPLLEIGSAETSRLARALNTMADELAQMIRREVDQRAEIEAILGCMVEGIIAVDMQGRVLRLNAAAIRMFGVKHYRSGRSIEEVVRHADLQHFIQQALIAQEPVESELELLGLEKCSLHLQATPLTDSQQQRIGVVVAVHDLTRLRQLESVRRDFVANVSHELKTPITAIRGAVETLLDEEVIDRDGRKFLQIIFNQGERLNALIEDLLDLSRIEQGASQGGWQLEPGDLLPVLEGARTACETLMNHHQVSVDIQCPEHLQVMMHPQLLEQAVINLLTNAIKYSEVNSLVRLDVRVEEHTIDIRVEDCGCGIDEKHLARIFERFYRADPARSRRLGGTGLGLAIVKHVALAHQGDVSVASTVGEGSCFVIHLPRS